MKKLIAVIVIFVCLGSALSAQSNFALGGGVSGSFTFISTGNLTGDLDALDLSLPAVGVYGFIDIANFLEVDLGMSLLLIIPVFEMGAYARLPINLGVITLFPMAGIEYTGIFLFSFNTLWARAGAGMDINLGEKLFLRPELLYGIELLNWKKFDVGLHGLKARVALGFRL